ncbi:MAG: hypothetical protein WAL34_09600 [Acidobacteriaceae bacterium]
MTGSGRTGRKATHRQQAVHTGAQRATASSRPEPFSLSPACTHASAGWGEAPLERLITDLSGSGPLVFVFGDGFTAAHLKGVTAPLFRGPADRRWWHVELGDETASWTMDVRVDEITGLRFVRAPYPFRPHFPGQEVLGVDFLGPGGDKVLHCGVHDLYEGERMRPEKLAAWRALRERYGNRDESKVDQGTLMASAA